MVLGNEVSLSRWQQLLDQNGMNYALSRFGSTQKFEVKKLGLIGQLTDMLGNLNPADGDCVNPACKSGDEGGCNQPVLGNLQQDRGQNAGPLTRTFSTITVCWISRLPVGSIKWPIGLNCFAPNLSGDPDPIADGKHCDALQRRA